jgi:hypothetical protein
MAHDLGQANDGDIMRFNYNVAACSAHLGATEAKKFQRMQ